MSSGYVADMAKIPAPAPAVSLVIGPSCAFGSLSRARAKSHPSRVSYARNLDAEFGTMRMQFAPLPLNMPAIPSVFMMCASPRATPLYAVVVLPATCCKILRRSRGATAVRETPPATPPATSDLQISIRPTPVLPSPALGAMNPVRA
jgi:hypothetical protein